jgi:pimeloyl-ACP methyl ester carboxylesterase
VSTLLVHGGGFAGSCWDRLVPYLDDDVVAIDLPGRGSESPDLAAVRSSDFVKAIVAEVERLGDDVLLVGHSMAGIAMPRVMARVGANLRGAVFVSCAVPPDGRTVIDVLSGVDFGTIDLSEAAAMPAIGGVEAVLDPALARVLFCNDMDEETTWYTLSLMVPEARSVIGEPIDTSGVHVPLPKTWIRLLDDAVLAPGRQDAMIARIPGIDVIDLDAGHMAMITRPVELAALLNEH